MLTKRHDRAYLFKEYRGTREAARVSTEDRDSLDNWVRRALAERLRAAAPVETMSPEAYEPYESTPPVARR